MNNLTLLKQQTMEGTLQHELSKMSYADLIELGGVITGWIDRSNASELNKKFETLQGALSDELSLRVQYLLEITTHS